jgi:hypothetical protein
VVMDSSVFCGVVPSTLSRSINILEEHIISIFRVGVNTFICLVFSMLTLHSHSNSTRVEVFIRLYVIV